MKGYLLARIGKGQVASPVRKIGQQEGLRSSLYKWGDRGGAERATLVAGISAEHGNPRAAAAGFLGSPWDSAAAGRCEASALCGEAVRARVHPSGNLHLWGLTMAPGRRLGP